MSFSEWSNNKKKKQSGSFSEWSNTKHGITEEEKSSALSWRKDEDIAPVKTAQSSEKEKKTSTSGVATTKSVRSELTNPNAVVEFAPFSPNQASKNATAQIAAKGKIEINENDKITYLGKIYEGAKKLYDDTQNVNLGNVDKKYNTTLAPFFAETKKSVTENFRDSVSSALKGNVSDLLFSHPIFKYNSKIQQALQGTREIKNEKLNSYLAQYGVSSMNELEALVGFQGKYAKYLMASDYEKFSVAGKSKRTNKGTKILGEKGDDVYDFINDINGYREVVRISSAMAQQREKYGNYTKYSFLNEDEIGVYNYIYAKEGKDKANEYLDEMEASLQKAYGEDTYENMSTVRKSLFWLPSGIENWKQGVTQFFSSDEIAPTYVQVASDKVKQEAYDNSEVLGTLYSAGETVSNQIPNLLLTKGVGTVAQGLGVGVSAATKIGKVTSAAGMFTSSAGNAYGDALREGKTKEEARTYSNIVGALETGLQYAIGGISEFGGISDTQIMNKVALIKNPILRTVSKYGVQVAAETTEEEMQLWLEPLVRSIVFDEEYDAPTLEEMVETAVVTGISTGVLNASSNISEGTKVNGLTYSDAKVVDKLTKDAIAEIAAKGEKVSSKEKSKIYDDIVERMDKGDIEIDTIEEVLGGETFEEYKSLTDKEKSLTDEISQLENMPDAQITVKQKERLVEARQELENLTGKDELKSKLSDEVYGLAKEGRLVESYNEKTRRSQAFEVDLTQYKGKKKEAYERAVKSGVLNNTNKSHALVDTLAAIEAEKGIIFDYTDNKKLKEVGFAIEGKTVNGFESNGKVTLNIQSAKSWQSVVGHEISHVLEGTDSYNALRETLFKYAESKGELATRRANLTELYKDIDADIDAELTADLVGDYLFSDSNFIKNLSGNRNLFQRVYGEIKYLCKVATGKELTEIEKVRKEFDNVWKEFSVNTNAESDGKVNLSVSEIVDENKKSYGVGVRLDSTLLDNLSSSERVEMVKEYVKELGGNVFTAYDSNGNATDITIAQSNARFKNQNNTKVKVNRDLTTKNIKNETKQEAISLVDELIVAAKYDNSKPAAYPHGWLDNNGKNDWEYWTTYIQDKNNTIWEATLNVANTANGEKFLYDISPIKKVGQSVKSDTIPTDGIVTENGNDVKRNFSVSKDSQGNELSKEQQKYFKDSKVVDENGNLKVMYHGSPNADFTVFKSGTYFTEHKWYADVYQNQGASSLSYKKTANNPDTYAVYLDIKKPFDTRNKTERDIFYNEYYRQWGTGTGLMESGLPDWLDGQDLQEFLEENGYDYDGLILDEGATGGYGEEAKSRGISYVIFNPEQVKNIDNQNPTDNPDIRKSLSKQGEQSATKGTPLKDLYLAPTKEDIAPVKENATPTEFDAPMVEEMSTPKKTVPLTDKEIADSLAKYIQDFFIKYDSTQLMSDTIYDGSLDEEVKVYKTAFREYKKNKGVYPAPYVEDKGLSDFVADMVKDWRTNYDSNNLIHRKLDDLQNVTTNDIAPVKENIPTAKETRFSDDFAPLPEGYEPITEEEANALQSEQFESITDMDAPPEVETEYYSEPDTTAIDNKTLKNIGETLRETLSLTAAETKAIQEIVQEYSTTETSNKDVLFDTIKEKFGEKVWKEKNEELAEVKRFLRTNKVNVSPKVKADIADYAAFRKGVGAKLGTSKDGLSIDVAYQQLVEMYPDYFSEDIWNETDQFLRMAEVANMGLYQYESYSLDDGDIQKAVDIISSEVNSYKNELTRIAAEDTAREALDAIAPTRAEQLTDGSRGDALLNQSLDNHPIKTVEERITEKIRAVEAEIADNKQLRRETETEYNAEIERLTAEYLSKKDKNTKVANNIIRRIAKLHDLKASVDADYGKRISDLEARAEKMKDPKYNRAMHKQDKMQSYAKWAENIIGDTSTWEDKKLGLKYAVNTERRNLRDIIKDENGNADIKRADAISEELSGKYNQHEAELKRELAQIRKKYADLKITKAEDAYIQMLGELRGNPKTELTEKVVKEYYEKHKNKIDAAKVDKIVELARQDYDNMLKRVNEKLKEQGMREIPYRQGYFPHFTESKQNFIQKLLNWKTQDNEIPTSIAGLTEDFKPVKSWQSFDKTRHSDTTDYSFMKGFDNYSQGALDWIYHLEDIQKRRAVENYIRYSHSDEGIQARIKEVYADKGIDANEAQAQIEQILSEAKNPLNNFVQDFTTKTNVLAGKKNSFDRTIEQYTNRHIYSVMTNVQNRTSANLVLANVRSALTNFIPITQSWAQVSPLRTLQATKDTIANAIKDDGLTDKSTFLTNRLKEVDNLYNSAWDKVLDKAGIMFEVIDNFSSQVIWRSKYNQNLAKGMTESEAIKNADQFAENVMAGRSKGNEPTLFTAKNPLVKAFTMFQLEVNNQYGYFFKDVPNDLKAETNHWKLNLAKGYTTAFIGAYVYNALFEKIAGSGAALDPIGIIEDLLKDLGLLGDDDEEEDTVTTVTNLTENVVKELPFVGGLLGGGRIPISSALPYNDKGFMGGFEAFAEDVSNFAKDDWSGAKNIGEEMMNPLLNIGLPVGGGQLKKTVQGLKMFNTDEEHPVAGSYTNSGNLRFPVDDTLANRIQAGIFGQYASKNAREYFDNDYAPLKEKQIQEYVDTELPIADYWKYLEGLNDLEPLEGKETVSLNQKGDYIGGLDLPVEVKNILINNIANDRKTPIDFTGYENYSNFEEFDFATRYPEKYAVLKEQGISVADYKENYEETAFMYTDDYSWAANNPEQYTVSKAITNDVKQYKQYKSDLSDIKADKDENGKTISGSAKEKKIEYINNLDLDYGQKIILYRSMFDSKEDKAEYDADIVEYLNNRDDLTYDERITIFEELGFTVKDGYVYWD